MVDESRKDGRTIFRKRGRAPRGQRAEISVDFVRGDRYSIIAALTVNGYIDTRVVPGSKDSKEFFDFIVKRLYVLICYNLPCVSKIYSSLK